MIKPGMFRKIAALAVVFAFLFHITAFLPAQSENELDNQFEKIKLRYQNGQYANAKIRIERLIGIISEKKVSLPYIMGQCYLLLGAIYEKEENATLAEENYKKGKENYGITKVDGVKLEGLPLFKKFVTGNVIEGEGIKKKKKFPWLWVIGGVVVVGVTLYFILKKKAKTYYNLNVTEHPGVEGTPVEGTHRYEQGNAVSYTYRTRPGYGNLQVLLDGSAVSPSGEITMDANHTLTFTATQNQYQLQLSTTDLQVPENQTASFTARLTQQPAANVTVTTTYLDGDGDISVQSGASLTFTPSNWNTPKTVTLKAADDQDIIHGTTRFNVRIQGQTPVVVNAAEVDDDIDDTLTVKITVPDNNDTVSGNVNIYAEASGQKGIEKVEYFIDGNLVKTDLNTPYKLKWDSTTVQDGPHTVKVIAYDTAGQTVSDQISVTVRNDPGNYRLNVTRGPGVTGEPASGTYSYKSGETVNYDFQVQSGYGSLVVLLDGEAVEASGTIVMDRDHTLIATAQSSHYRLTVSKGAGVDGTPDSGTHSYPAGETVSYSYTAVNAGQSVSVYLDGQPAAASGTITMDRDHSLDASTNAVILNVEPASLEIIEGQTGQVNVRLSAQPQNNIDVTVSIIDNGDSDLQIISGQNLTFTPSDWSTNQTVTVQADWDTDEVDNPAAILRFESDDLPTKEIAVSKREDLLPVVSIEQPQNSETVSGAVVIKARASDAIGIDKIELYIEGTLVNTVTASTMEYTWDTSTLTLKDYTIQALAYDTSGQTDEETISVTLENQPPTVESIDITPNAATLTGTVSVAVNAQDDRGVDIIRVYIDDNLIQEWNQEAQPTVQFTFDLDTTTYTNGVYSLKAVAVDTDAVESEPTTINIAIQN